MNTSQRISIVLCVLLIAGQGFSLTGIVGRGNYDFALSHNIEVTRLLLQTYNRENEGCQ